MRRYLVALPSALLLLAGCATRAPLDIEMSGSVEGQPCMAQMQGRMVDIERVPAIVRQGGYREVHIRGSIATPFRCVGALIFALQRIGIRRIGFISEPAATK